MDDLTAQVVKKNIKSRLKNLGKTQAWLAAEMDIKTGYLSELINGKAGKRWNATTLDKASKALNLTVGELLNSPRSNNMDEWTQTASKELMALAEEDREDYDNMMKIFMKGRNK